MEPTFKKARWLGVTAESLGRGNESDTIFWRKFKCYKVIDHQNLVVDLDLIPSSQQLFAISGNRLLSSSGQSDFQSEPTAIFKTSDEISSFATRSDGLLLAVGSSNGKIHVIDQNKNILRELSGHKAAVKSLKFFPNKKNILSTSDDGAVKVWDISEGKELWTSNAHQDFVRSSAISFIGDRFASGSYDHSIKVWNNDDHSDLPYASLDHGEPVYCLTFVPGDKILISGGLYTIKLWDLNTKTLLNELKTHHKAVTGVKVSPCGLYLASSSLDKSIRITRLEDLKLLFSYRFPSSVLSFSLKGEPYNFAAGLSDGRVFLYKNPELSRVSTRTRDSRKKADVMTHIEEEQSLKKFDRFLQKFRYRHAFDYVIARKSPQLLVTAISELTRRQGLEIALSGRTEAEFITIIELVAKNIHKPRYTLKLFELVFQIAEHCSEATGKTKEFDATVSKLIRSLHRLAKDQEMLIELEGKLGFFLVEPVIAES